MLALILVYMFSIIGYIFFKDDFLISIDDDLLGECKILRINVDFQAIVLILESCNNEKDSDSNTLISSINHNYCTEQKAASLEEKGDRELKERACDSMLMCIVTTLNQGLRNGGGIGDILRAPSSKEPLFVPRVIYDLLFFFIVIIIVLNLIFGVIIDTFADLRSEKQLKETTLKNTCFICGLNRSAFDNKTVSFEDHIQNEHK